MQAVLGESQGIVARLMSVDQMLHVHPQMIAIARGLVHRRDVVPQVLVGCLGIGERRGLLFDAERRDHSDTRLVGRQVFEQLLKLRVKRFQPGVTRERLVEAVGQKDHGRLEGVDMFDEQLIAVGRSAKPARASPPNGVAAPAEIAELDVAAWITTGEHRLPIAVALLAFDHRRADQHDAVAVFQLERFGASNERKKRKQPNEGGEANAMHGTSERQQGRNRSRRLS